LAEFAEFAARLRHILDLQVGIIGEDFLLYDGSLRPLERLCHPNGLARRNLEVTAAFHLESP